MFYNIVIIFVIGDTVHDVLFLFLFTLAWNMNICYVGDITNACVYASDILLKINAVSNLPFSTIANEFRPLLPSYNTQKGGASR